MIVTYESSFKDHKTGSYNAPTRKIFVESGCEFVHHGVKNQHWGVKNGPPYPLSGANKQKAKASYKKPPKNPEKEGDYKPENSSSSKSSSPKVHKDEKKTVETQKKPTAKQNNRKRFEETNKKMDAVYKEWYDRDENIRAEQDKEFEKGLEKYFGKGITQKEAWDQCVAENDLLDSGKLKYEKSKWAKYNELSDRIYNTYGDGDKKYTNMYDKSREEYKKKMQEIVDAHVDDMIKNNVKLNSSNLGAKKKWNAEHQMWSDREKEYLLEQIEDYSSKYEIDWNTGEIRHKKK